MNAKEEAKMNKDDLLKKAQEESGKAGFDEREQKLAMQGSAVAFSIGGMLCMLINLASYIFSGIDPLVGTTCWVIWTGMQAADCMFKVLRCGKSRFCRSPYFTAFCFSVSSPYL